MVNIMKYITNMVYILYNIAGVAIYIICNMGGVVNIINYIADVVYIINYIVGDVV